MEKTTNKIMAEVNKRHILILLTQDLGSPSGIGRYFPLAKYLVRCGLNVTIIALHSDYERLTDKETVVDGVQVRYVAQMHVSKRGNQTQYYSSLKLFLVALRAMRALALAALQEPADYLIVGKPHPMNSIAAIWASKRRRSVLIVDCDDFEAESNHFTSPWQKKVIQWFENNVPKKAKFVTTNTWFTYDRLVSQGVPKEKIIYMPNGIDPERFPPLSPDEIDQLRAVLGLKNSKVVAFIGSLNLSNHPVQLLIQSFSMLASDVPEAKLLIVGGGKDKDLLCKHVDTLGLDERVVFTGRVDSKDVAKYYEIADVTVDPVEDDLAAKGRCPLKLFESWYMGTPMVTSDVGDRKLLTQDGTLALLARPGDPADLAEKIKVCLRDTSVSTNLRLLGIEGVKGYDWERLAGNFVSIIGEQKDGFSYD